MKKIQEQNETEKVVAKLTGHFETDRKTLLNAIKDFRKRNVEFEDCRNLGVALYKLLLDNGLNESDVINPDRLLDKIDGFLYANQVNMALDILEVIDAVQPFQKADKKGNRVYSFENEIEARIFKEDGIVANDIIWIESARPNLLARKAKILVENQMFKEAQAVIDELLEINPVSFVAYILRGLCFREKNPKKYKENVLLAHKYAYTPDQFVQFFSNLHNYYADKEDWVSAYATLSAIKIYDINDQLLDDIDALKEKMTRTVVTPFKVPTAEQILKLLEREGIEVQISDKNYSILLNFYEELFLAGERKGLMQRIAEYVQGFAGQEDILKIIEKRLKK